MREPAGRSNKYYPVEPPVGMGDYRLLGKLGWGRIDQVATEALRTDCVAIPSIRVGMAWTLDYLGCSRHSAQVLLPKFVSRCILNSLNRYALPVESLTPDTRLVVAVHQYGLKQDLDAIQQQCEARAVPYIEDSPYGLDKQEGLGPGSLAKFIGLSKILPVLKGALVISDDQPLLRFLKDKRGQTSLWSWPVLVALALLRRRRTASGESTLAAAAYEMYLDSKGDNRWLRGNLLSALTKLNSFARDAGRRLDMVADRFKSRAVAPDTGRISCVVPFFPATGVEPWQRVLDENGFDPSTYHIDVARNLFSPSYEKALLLPMNPRIPMRRFENMLNGLAELDALHPAEEAPKAEASV